MFDKSKVYDDDGFFDAESAVAQLIENSILFVGYKTYTHKPRTENKNDVFTADGHTIILWVNCSDVFVWACSDAEDVGNEKELEELYNLCVDKPHWGSAIWCCMKRGEKPQRPVANYIKDCEEWTKELDSLADNMYDKVCEDELKNKNEN